MLFDACRQTLRGSWLRLKNMAESVWSVSAVSAVSADGLFILRCLFILRMALYLLDEVTLREAEFSTVFTCELAA